MGNAPTKSGHDGYVGDIRNAWTVHYLTGRKITVYDTADVYELLNVAETGSVIMVTHDVIIWGRKFMPGMYPGDNLSSARVTDTFETLYPMAFMGA